MNEYVVLYGIKDIDKFYITNLDPIIWEKDLSLAKRYNSKTSATNIILYNILNYSSIEKLIKSKILDGFYIASISNGIEIWRLRLL